MKCRKTIKTTFLNGDDVQLLKDVEHKEDCEPKMRPKLMKNFVFENFVFDSIKAVCLRVDGYRFKVALMIDCLLFTSKLKLYLF